MAETPVEPREVAERVERYVDRELADAEKYDNRSPLDDSGVWSLHRLAAELYALGFADCEASAAVKARGELWRERERIRAKVLAEVYPLLKALWDVHSRWCVLAGPDVNPHDMDAVCEVVEQLEPQIRRMLQAGDGDG